MAIVSRLLGGIGSLKFSVLKMDIPHCQLLFNLVIISQGTQGSFASDRIGCWCQNVCSCRGAVGVGVRESGSVLHHWLAAALEKSPLWTSVLSPLRRGTVGFCVKKLTIL